LLALGASGKILIVWRVGYIPTLSRDAFADGAWLVKGYRAEPVPLATALSGRGLGGIVWGRKRRAHAGISIVPPAGAIGPGAPLAPTNCSLSAVPALTRGRGVSCVAY